MLIALVATRFPGSTKAMAAVMAWTVLPAFLVSPVAGASVDRWDRRRTMLASDLVRAAGILMLPAAAATAGSMLPVYGLIFLVYGGACFFLPARLALLPSLVSADALVAANSLLTTSGMIGATTCMLIGGLLVEHIGVPASCVVTTASYLASAACVLMIRSSAVPAPSGPRSPLIREILEGLRYAVSQLHAQFVLLTLWILSAASGAIFVVATVMVQQALGSVTRDLGVFSITLGLGLFLGTVGYGRFGERWDKPVVILLGLVAGGVCLASFTWGVGAWRSWAAGWGTTVLLGMCVAPIGTAVNALIHELVRDRLRGRVFSVMGIVMNAGMLTGLWAAGIVADRLTPVHTLTALALALIVGGLVSLTIVRARRVIISTP